MRSFVDLLRTSEGRGILEAHGVLMDPAGFRAELAPPARQELGALLGLGPEARPVYVGQQVQPDYPRSVTAKFRAARDLAPEANPVVVWLDTDRAGSHKGQTTLSWLGREGQARTTRLAPRRWKELEVRFVPVSDHDLSMVERDLAKWVGELPRRDRTRAEDRRRMLVDGLSPGRLAEVSRSFASFLLQRGLGFAPPSVFASELVSAGLLDTSMNALLASVDDVVSVANAAIDDLRASDVDPVLKPLPDDYLPLHVTCSRDGARRRPRHVRRGDEHVAISACPCGQEDRFSLGSGSPSLGELAGTDRWSPDVSIPVCLNGLASGVVVGRSSALYGIVLNQVVEKVLGERPVPMLVPPDLEAVLGDDRRPDSLLFDALTAP